MPRFIKWHFLNLGGNYTGVFSQTEVLTSLTAGSSRAQIISGSFYLVLSWLSTMYGARSALDQGLEN